MKRSKPGPGCACCSINRRQFLAAGGAACAGAVGWMTGPGASPAGAAAKTRIRIIYSLHSPQQKQPDWPNHGL